MVTQPIQIKSMAPLLLVINLQRSITFYETYLGFKADFFYEDFYAGITNGVYQMHLKLDYSGNARPQKEADNIDFTFAVTGIEAFYKAVCASGVTITQPLRQMPYGTEFYAADPDGYILSFLEI